MRVPLVLGVPGCTRGDVPVQVRAGGRAGGLNVRVVLCISKEKKEAHVLHNIRLSINLCSGALVFECNVLGDNIKIRSPLVLGRCTCQTRLT